VKLVAVGRPLLPQLESCGLVVAYERLRVHDRLQWQLLPPEPLPELLVVLSSGDFTGDELLLVAGGFTSCGRCDRSLVVVVVVDQ